MMLNKILQEIKIWWRISVIYRAIAIDLGQQVAHVAERGGVYVVWLANISDGIVERASDLIGVECIQMSEDVIAVLYHKPAANILQFAPAFVEQQEYRAA